MGDEFKAGVVYRKEDENPKPTTTDVIPLSGSIEFDPSNFEEGVVYRIPSNTEYKHKHKGYRCPSSDMYCDYRYVSMTLCVSMHVLISLQSTMIQKMDVKSIDVRSALLIDWFLKEEQKQRISI